ncbi:cystatin C (amyloid angiopathy and cerebral hemorrhage) [Diretmus argenteus]
MALRMILPILAALFAVGISASMPGAPVDAEVTDPGVQNALNFAVVQHNKGTNDKFLSKVAQVVRVQKQVVAGINYIITVQMGRTSCAKSGVEDACAISEDPATARSYQCTFTVWSRPWLNEIQLTKQKCE